MALIVSGGHTSLYHVERKLLEDGRGGYRYSYRLLGHTVDDAAGEAYDKVAKLLALGYPGGPVIDRLARGGNPEAVSFTRPNIKRGRRYDFSFSGIKTAVVRWVEKNGRGLSRDPQAGSRDAEAEQRRAALSRLSRAQSREDAHRASRDAQPIEELCSQQTLDLLASFQHAVVEDLAERTLAAADDFEAHAVFVSGGVAANSQLRKTFAEECAVRGVPVFFPSVQLSTDNAAMIAAAAYPKFLAGEFAGLDLNADPALRLGS